MRDGSTLALGFKSVLNVIKQKSSKHGQSFLIYFKHHLKDTIEFI